MPREIVTAIFVDGGFYRKRANALFGDKEPGERADELLTYCHRHLNLNESRASSRSRTSNVESRASLYRIFYYDCPPSDKLLYHPLNQRSVALAKTPQYAWMQEFFAELVKKRKVALRRGEELNTQRGYYLKRGPLKALCAGSIQVSDLTEKDFGLDITQKGVDMRIGLDIASVAQKKQANQIIMISGDSDFVPAAKHARREGIDFVLDPMWAHTTDSLREHVDGVRSCVPRPPKNMQDPLCSLPLEEGSDEQQTQGDC